MAVMGVSSITPAFPEISSALNITSIQTGYLISVFTLPGIFLSPVLGVLADKMGRKTVLIPALLLFGAAGFTCFFIRDFHLLLFFRFLQGAGAASIGSLNVTLIGDLFTGNQRSTAMGYNASVLSIGTAMFPAIGGLFAGIAWYYPFVLPVIAIPIGITAMMFLDAPAKEKLPNLRQYLRQAILKMKNIKVVTVFLTSILFFLIIYGAFLTYFPFLMKNRFDSSPFLIGIVMSGASLFSAITSSQLGKMMKRFKNRTLILFSFLLYIIALSIVPFVQNVCILFIPAFILGMANGICMPLMQTILSWLAPQQYRAIFMSVNGMILRIGQTLGPLYTGLFYVFFGIKGAFFSLIVPVLLMGLLAFRAFRDENYRPKFRP